MEDSIYRYVIRHSLRAQVVLTALAVASFPFLYAFYEVPKQIVNRAIQGGADGFPAVVLGASLSQLEYLFLLCGGFLLLVVVNQAFKNAINVLAGRTGDTAVCPIRLLCHHPSGTRRSLRPRAVLPDSTTLARCAGS